MCISTPTGRAAILVPDCGERLVCIDGDPRAYPAHVSPRRWNGFASPSFRRDVAQLVVDDLTDTQPGMLAWDGDVVLYRHYWDEPGEGDLVERIAPDACGRYPIGARGWCWIEAACAPVGEGDEPNNRSSEGM